MRIFTDHQQVIDEIVTAIEANGTDVASADEYDVEAIADKCFNYDFHHGGYAQVVDEERFWAVVQETQRT